MGTVAGTVSAMTGPDDPPLPWWRSGRVFLYGGSALAVFAAAVIAVGADDLRLLRLGIVAALWAALLGTFAAVRLRQEMVQETAPSANHDESRTIAQLERDLEAAARRERELIADRERREAAEREDIAALRAELGALRNTLRDLLGGDLLVERVALRAESTRLRPLSERAAPVRPLSERPAPVHPSTEVRTRAVVDQPAFPDAGDRQWAPAVSAGTSWDYSPAAPRPNTSNGLPSRAARHGRPSEPTHQGPRSVDDLLAAHGRTPVPRHRRRRGDD